MAYFEDSPTGPANQSAEGSSPRDYQLERVIFAACPHFDISSRWLESDFLPKVKLTGKDTVSSILRGAHLPLVTDPCKLPRDVEALTQCDCYTGLLTRLATTRISLSFHNPYDCRF
jgi:hypothetical protein